MAGSAKQTVPLSGWRLWAARGFLVSLVLIILGALLVIMEEPMSGRPYWRRQGAFFGVDAENKIRLVEMKGSAFTDEAIACLMWSTGLQDLILERSSITDVGGTQLCRFPLLQRLDLSQTQVTDATFQDLILPELTWLDLSETAITDKTLRQLSKFPKLQMVNLSGTQITDAGLAELGQCITLMNVSMRDCHVTNRGVAALCKVNTKMGLDYEFQTLEFLTDEQVRNLPGAAECWLKFQPAPPRNYPQNKLSVTVDHPDKLKSIFRPKVVERLTLFVDVDPTENDPQRTEHIVKDSILAALDFRKQLSSTCELNVIYNGPLCDGYLLLLPITSPAELEGVTWRVSGRIHEPNVTPKLLETLLTKHGRIPRIHLDHASSEQIDCVLKLPMTDLVVTDDDLERLPLGRLSNQTKLQRISLTDEFITSLDLTPLTGLPGLKHLSLKCPQLAREDIIGLEHFPEHIYWDLRPSPGQTVSRSIDATGLME